jgi:hypothetical protein
MSPIGLTLLTLCENDLSIERSKVEELYSGMSLLRAKTVALLLGITIKDK